MNSSSGTAEAVGFPIRTSPDQSLLSDSPGLIAAGYALHRRFPPRHPPRTLINLTLICENHFLNGGTILTIILIYNLVNVPRKINAIQLSKSALKLNAGLQNVPISVH